MFAKLERAQKPNIRENIASVAISGNKAEMSRLAPHDSQMGLGGTILLFLSASPKVQVGGRIAHRSSQ